ncbi:MAG: hypothetical protein ACJA2Z_000244, partial [Candidatus Paceibacteria bacterium]
STLTAIRDVNFTANVILFFLIRMHQEFVEPTKENVDTVVDVSG